MLWIFKGQIIVKKSLHDPKTDPILKSERQRRRLKLTEPDIKASTTALFYTMLSVKVGTIV